jgi:hypothetical protein
MKKTILILLSMLLLSSVLNAQESIMFDKQFLFDDHGSYPRDLKQTPDGGYVCAGGIGFSMYDDRYLLFKTDSLGELEWYNYSDSSAVHSTLWAVDLTKTGGYVGIGSTQDNPDWHNSGAIVMYDSLGDTLWTKQYAFNNPFIPGTKYGIFFNDGKCTSDNCILAAGSIMEDNLGTDPNPIVVKTNLQGDTLWTWRLFEEGNRIIIMSVAETQEGDYVAVGRADKPIVDTEKTTYAPQRGFIVKISQAGELIYLKEWTDIDYNLFDDVAINSEGELLIAGTYFNHPPEFPDDENFGLLLKTDSYGNTVFFKTIEYGIGLHGFTVNVSSSNDIVFVGYFAVPLTLDWKHDVLLRKYSNNGDLLWSRNIGDKEAYDWPYSVITTNDNGIAFCGLYSPDTGNYSWLVKTDSLGNGVYSDGWINDITINDYDQEIRIYPNPANQNINVQFQNEQNRFNVSIFSFDGRAVKHIENSSNTVYVGDLTNGLYLLKITLDNRSITKKIMVKR